MAQTKKQRQQRALNYWRKEAVELKMGKGKFQTIEASQLYIKNQIERLEKATGENK